MSRLRYVRGFAVSSRKKYAFARCFENKKPYNQRKRLKIFPRQSSLVSHACGITYVLVRFIYCPYKPRLGVIMTENRQQYSAILFLISCGLMPKFRIQNSQFDLVEGRLITRDTAYRLDSQKKEDPCLCNSFLICCQASSSYFVGKNMLDFCVIVT